MKRNNWMVWLLVATMMILLTACGGGGATNPDNNDTNATGTNNAPVANAQSITTDEDDAKSITLSGTDADGDTLTYTVTHSPTHGTLSGTAPNLTYTPNMNYYGSDSFRFKVNDGTVDSAESTVLITVRGAFIIKVQTKNDGSSSHKEFTITTLGSGFDYSVDCDSDGNNEITGTDSNYTCRYPTAGEYTIKIKGTYPRISFGDPSSYSDSSKLIEVVQWGSTQWSSMSHAFHNCYHLTTLPADSPDLSNVSDMSYMFCAPILSAKSLTIGIQAM